MRRQTFWFGSTFASVTIASASTASLITSLNAAALAFRPFTIVRTRGVFTIRSDQLAGSEDQSGAYGRIVVSDQSVAIGVTAVPTPVTDSQSDWHVYEPFMDSLRFLDATGFQLGTSRQYIVDSKAMRKVSEGQESAISSGIVFVVATKILIKLH